MKGTGASFPGLSPGASTAYDMQEPSFIPLHTAEDRQDNRRSIRTQLIILGVILAFGGALIACSLIWRDNTHLHNVREVPSQLITMGITILIGSAAILFWSIRISPLLAYRKYLRDLTRGLSRSVDGILQEFDESPCTRDGLSFYRLVVNVDDPPSENGERIVYWDAKLPRPHVAAGTRLQLVVHGNEIIAMEAR